MAVRLLLIGVMLSSMMTSLSFAGESQKRAVLLLGFNPTKNASWIYKKRFSNYSEGLTRLFSKTMAENKDLVFETVTGATQFELYSALKDPNNVAVFWISHSLIGSSQQVSGIGTSSRIVDGELFDVTPVFKEAHSDLRYLAVIGCESDRALAPLHVQNPGLKVETFDHKVDAKRALKTSLENFEMLRSEGRSSETTQQDSAVQSSSKGVQTLEVTVQRKFESPNIQNEELFFPAVRIEIDGKIQTVMPRGVQGASDQMVSFAYQIESGARLPELVINAGDRIILRENTLMDLGRFTVKATQYSSTNGNLAEIYWEPFVDHSGKVLGSTKHVYLPN